MQLPVWKLPNVCPITSLALTWKIIIWPQHGEYLRFGMKPTLILVQKLLRLQCHLFTLAMLVFSDGLQSWTRVLCISVYYIIMVMFGSVCILFLCMLIKMPKIKSYQRVQRNRAIFKPRRVSNEDDSK